MNPATKIELNTTATQPASLTSTLSPPIISMTVDNPNLSILFGVCGIVFSLTGIIVAILQLRHMHLRKKRLEQFFELP